MAGYEPAQYSHGMPASDHRTDYARVADAIDWLRTHRHAQPELAELARHMHLSEAHVQRLFTRWAGISPKRFLQSLTLASARERLLGPADLLAISGDLGLSGPGRLHDLFVTFEAMSPGEARSGGAGQQLHWGVHDTPFGEALIATSPRGVCAVHFLAEGEAPTARLQNDWPNARLEHRPDTTAATATALFRAARPAPLALWLKGSNFQLQVWRALLAIPPGRLTSYGALAATLGQPNAARAVGHAVAANPLAVCIPCHRVIRASGLPSAYRWGEARKAAIQAWELGGEG